MFMYAMRRLGILAAAAAVAACAGEPVTEPDGARLFARHCASCHGSFGEGDGPVAEVMQVAVPNLRSLSARANGSFPRDAVMRYIDGREVPAAHGERLMPVWGDSFEAAAGDAIAAITDFVERLQN